MSTHISKVIIVGAGLCGAFLALILARHGVEVVVLEAANKSDQRLRGTIYGPASIHALTKAGILDEMCSVSFNFRNMSWRSLHGNEMLRVREPGNAYALSSTLCYPVHIFVDRIMAHLSTEPLAQVCFNHMVISTSQNGNRAWVEVMHGDEHKVFVGDFVVGCDGSESEVRKSLFGSHFPGTTWNKQLAVIDIECPYTEEDWPDYQFVVDPEEWAVVHKLSNDTNSWRVMFGVEAGLSTEEIRRSFDGRLAKILPGIPTSDHHSIHNYCLYKMHQRCVDNMVCNRIVLAGDAAHLTNPIGDLGIATGLTDITSLAECFIGVNDRVATLDIFNNWDEARREIYHEYVAKSATINLQRLMQDPEGIFDRDPFLKRIKKAQDFSDADSIIKAEAMSIVTDMRQYYSDTAAWNGALSNPDCVMS